MNKPELYNEGHAATYSPEDNKLRLYVGRVPRDEYLALKAEGWKALHKQREAGGGDFVAIWSPERRQTALSYAASIDDEDMGPEERAADRAERFTGYLEKRLGEAGENAGKYDSGPHVHGFQSIGKAVRAADRHDRIAGRAVDAWEKAEYWERRTAGVISHALHVSSPAVRMGRIKTLEAEQRKCLQGLDEYAKLWADLKKLEGIADPVLQTEKVLAFVGSRNIWADYLHPRAESQEREYDRTNKRSLYSLLSTERDPISGAEACALFFSNHGEPKTETAWSRHYELRLAYENQMLQAQGGRAAFVEMEVGGWLGKHQIRKVNKSNATGRVVSVEVMGQTSGFTKASGYKEHATWACPVLVNIERLASNAYRAPTDEDKKALAATLKAEKAARPVVAACPLVNPTDEEAERLQTVWNERAADEHAAAKKRGKVYSDFVPAKVTRLKQATYSAVSGGNYGRAETREVCADANLRDRHSGMYSSEREEREKRIGPAVCKVRVTSGGDAYYTPRSVIVITDKPQKAFPAAMWRPRVVAEAVAPVTLESVQAAAAAVREASAVVNESPCSAAPAMTARRVQAELSLA